MIFETYDKTIPLTEWKFNSCNNCTWDNCPGKHLFVKCPNGMWWDLDCRATNCTMPYDKSHRCWIRWGDLPFITVNKDGKNIVGDYGQYNTCSAGGGSILLRNTKYNVYHGFLRNGSFINDGIPPEIIEYLQKNPI